MTQLESRNIIQPFATFDALYALGRRLETAEEILFHALSATEENEVNTLIISLLNFIQNQEEAFVPGMVELSLFDPADPSGNRFYTLLASTSASHLQAYVGEMKTNLDAEWKNRGAILPQENLYTAPYYRGFINGGKQRKFERLDPDNLLMQAGAFEAKRQLEDEVENVKTFISSFFQAVSDKIDMPSGKYDLNTALLVPLYRPAAPINRNQQNIFRGGGLFLFGQTKENFNTDAFALKLQSWLLKLVFEASHSQIEVEKLKFLQANVELGTYHHFSTNLRKIPGYLDPQNFGSDNLEETQVKKLEILSSSINYCIDNILSGLNSYKAFLNSEYASEKEYSTVGQLVDQLKKHRNAMGKQELLYSLGPKHIEIYVEPELRNRKLPFAHAALMPHLLELIGNAEKEYEIEQLSSDDRLIRFEIIQVGDADLKLSFYSHNTQFNQFVLDHGGKRPLNSVASSGLGLYFLNFSLGIFGARHSQDQGRNFELQNLTFPKRAQLSFIFPGDQS